jgi:hypothetical protein
MQQYDTQFINVFLQPLVSRIFTDIADGKNNPYLQKFFRGTEGEPLLETEKNDLIQDYFLQDQTKPFHTTTIPGDVEFQNKFLNTLQTLISVRCKLSGVDEARRSFSPDKDKKFSQEVSLNLYDLSYKMILSFEHQRINQLIDEKHKSGKMTESALQHDQAKNEAGQLRLVNIGGTDYYMSEEEVAAAAADPQMAKLGITPFVAVGTGAAIRQMHPGYGGQTGTRSQVTGAGIAGETTAGTVQQGQAGMEAVVRQGQAGYGVQAVAGAVPSQSTIGEVSGDFKAAKEKSIEMMLEEKGLKVTGDFEIDGNGIAHGVVEDVSGQKLKVDVNSVSAPDDPRKFMFTFVNAPSGGDSKQANRTANSFYLSQTDLSLFKPEDGVRRSADEVAAVKSGKIFADKKPTVLPQMTRPGSLAPGAIPIPPAGGKVGMTETHTLSAEEHEKYESTIEGALITTPQAAQMAAAARTKKTAPQTGVTTTTVMQRKRARVEGKKAAGQGAVHAPMQRPAQMPMPGQIPPQGGPGEEQASAVPRSKKRGSGAKLAVIATGGTLGATGGAIFGTPVIDSILTTSSGGHVAIPAAAISFINSIVHLFT